MRTALPSLLVLNALISPLRADLIDSIQINNLAMVVSPSMDEAWTDVPQNATTVRATLIDNPARMCWEFRMWNHMTSSRDLTSGLDVTTGSDIHARFFIYPNGHFQAPKYFYVYGTDVRDVNYSLANSTFEVKFRPVAPAITASYAGGLTAIAGIDFPYYGPGEVVNHSPPIISGNIVWDDVSKSSHPSSRFLLGAAIHVNGVDDQEVSFEYLMGTKYTAFKKYDINQAAGYLDGIRPASGFSYTLDDPTTTITTDVADNAHKRIRISNSNWSAHDVQAGVFLRLTNIVREAGGVRISWNAQGTNRYTIQSYSALNGPSNIVATNITGGNVLDTNAPASSRYYRLRAE